MADGLGNDWSPVTEAAEALLGIAQKCEDFEPPRRGELIRWQERSGDSIDDIVNGYGKHSFEERRRASFRASLQLALESLDSGMVDPLRRSVSALADGLSYLARGSDLSEQSRSAALMATLECCRLVRHPRRAKFKQQAARLTLPPSGEALEVLIGTSWDDFVAKLRMVQRAISQAEESLPAAPELNPTPVAESLLLGDRLERLDVIAPEYDKSDGERRIESVTLSHFRGVPNELQVDFRRSDTCISALILGDNGSGKSSIVDAIEFALQARIGRSVVFDGALSPSGASLANNEVPRVVVRLDDESEIVRTLESRDDGKTIQVGDPIRAGFRLAPISLKRQDILRFLDTEALSRGHIFFDYFPSSSEEMALRPEQLLEQLEGEAFTLRIRKRDQVTRAAQLLGCEESEIDSKDGLTRYVREHLLDGLSIDQATRSGKWDEIEETTRKTIFALSYTMSRLGAIKRERARGPEPLNPVKYQQQAALLGGALEGIGSWVTEAFCAITRAKHVARIDVVFGRSGPVALDVVVELPGGQHCFPQQIFSEGYRDLLAALFFMAVAKQAVELGQARILMLDDVFQSVDSTIRGAAIEYLVNEFRDWQLIFTVHDRLWFEQLRTKLRGAGMNFVERELRGWDFVDGPNLLANPAVLTTVLERELDVGEPASICGAAGRLLEQACDQLSWRLNVSLTRQRDDKYSLGDLWPGVDKAFRHTSLRETCSAIQSTYSLRNLAGAHYNVWAEALSLSEAHTFGRDVLTFVKAVWCVDCSEWIKRVGKDTIRCPGGHIAITAMP
jgi:hypothetical protein